MIDTVDSKMMRKSSNSEKGFSHELPVTNLTSRQQRPHDRPIFNLRGILDYFLELIAEDETVDGLDLTTSLKFKHYIYISIDRCSQWESGHKLFQSPERPREIESSVDPVLFMGRQAI